MDVVYHVWDVGGTLVILTSISEESQKMGVFGAFHADYGVSGVSKTTGILFIK